MTTDEPEQRTVGGVLLAAGRSTRFAEGNKLLASVEGTAVVRHAAASLLASSLTDVVVVVGYEADAVESALDGLDVETVHNERFEAGQSTSVARAVEYGRERDWDAAVFALGDMPFVESATVDTLCQAYADGEGSVLAPAYEGQRGNPVLFDARHFDALAAVDGDRGGRHIVEDHGTLLDVADSGVHRDIDRRVDLDDT